MAKFAVLMRENDHAWSKMSPEEQQTLLKRYFAWAEELRNAGRLEGGEPLKDGGRILRLEKGQVVDGPFTETKEVLTGFFFITALDLAEATEVARGCPALLHGETVELREIGH
jgi:hypothetical protein